MRKSKYIGHIRIEEVEADGEARFFVADSVRVLGGPFSSRFDADQEIARIQARIRKNRARNERNEAMRSLGLTRVRGNLGGIYWE